jgi:hypothetical protein
MNFKHIAVLVVVLVVGYLLGVKFPATGASLLGKVGA